MVSLAKLFANVFSNSKVKYTSVIKNKGSISS
jgi:hypothetical protein